MLKQYFERLYRYQAQANRKCLDALKAADTEEPELLKLMSHIVLSGCTWYERVSGAAATIKNVWDTIPLEILEDLSDQNSKDWLDLLEHSDETLFRVSIDYTNLQGKAFSNTVSDIMAHVVNHATYHRGQIAALMRSKGHTPATTDFIVFARETPQI